MGILGLINLEKTRKWAHFLGTMWFMPLLSTFFIMPVLKTGKFFLKYLDQGWVEYVSGQGSALYLSRSSLKFDYFNLPPHSDFNFYSFTNNINLHNSLNITKNKLILLHSFLNLFRGFNNPICLYCQTCIKRKTIHGIILPLFINNYHFCLSNYYRNNNFLPKNPH